MRLPRRIAPHLAGVGGERGQLRRCQRAGVAREIGKAEAHHWVEGLSKDTVARGAHLRDVALQALIRDERLRERITPAELAALFDADAPARHASALAAPQLAALATHADELRRDPPWQQHLERSAGT